MIHAFNSCPILILLGNAQQCMLGHPHLHKLTAFYDSLCAMLIEMFALVIAKRIVWLWPSDNL